MLGGLHVGERSVCMRHMHWLVWTDSCAVERIYENRCLTVAESLCMLHDHRQGVF